MNLRKLMARSTLCVTFWICVMTLPSWKRSNFWRRRAKSQHYRKHVFPYYGNLVMSTERAGLCRHATAAIVICPILLYCGLEMLFAGNRGLDFLIAWIGFFVLLIAGVTGFLQLRKVFLAADKKAAIEVNRIKEEEQAVIDADRQRARAAERSDTRVAHQPRPRRYRS